MPDDSMRVKTGSDIAPIVQSLLMQMDALRATTMVMMSMVEVVQSGASAPNEAKRPRTFGSKAEPGSDATGDRVSEPHDKE